jgi:hypothetical protein
MRKDLVASCQLRARGPIFRPREFTYSQQAVGCNVSIQADTLPLFLDKKDCASFVVQQYLLAAGHPVAPCPLKGMKLRIEDSYHCIAISEAMAYGCCQYARFDVMYRPWRKKNLGPRKTQHDQ